MTNVAGNRTEYLVGVRQNYARQAPSPVFRCGTEGCTLSATRTAESATRITHRTSPLPETAEMVVPFRSVNAG